VPQTEQHNYYQIKTQNYLFMVNVFIATYLFFFVAFPEYRFYRKTEATEIESKVIRKTSLSPELSLILDKALDEVLGPKS